MSEYPSQTRTIDPFSSYNSNVVNQLTRMITRGKNCLHSTHAIDVVIDATSSDSEVVILPGEGFKDDVIIQINDRQDVDFNDPNYYINHLAPFNEAGYYYVCIEYVYAKSKPAPQAKIRLLKPSQVHLYDEDNGAFLLLKIAEVVFNAGSGVFEIDGLFDSDPSNPSVKRSYSQLYAGVEDSLPTYDQVRDEGRLIYVSDLDEMFFGIENSWESFNAVRANIDTSLCSYGEIGYVDPYGIVQPAIASSVDTLADCIVIGVGVGKKGKVRLVGETQKVKIESGISINYGENVYLSETEAGTVTNNSSYMFPQYLGISTSSGTVNGECDIWFLPDRSTTANGLNNTLDFYQDLLNNSIFEYLFVEPFSNNDYIDSTASNIVTINQNLLGGSGDRYQTISLQHPSYSSCLVVAQISANYECTGTGSIDWFISNNGSDDLDWEVLELDKLHYFSTYGLEFSSTSGTFQIGENVLSSATNKMATVNGNNSGRLLVFGDTRKGVSYNIGETITGQTSGATGVLSVVIGREGNSYHDLRVKIELNGGSSDCKISDYGLIYDQDEDIFNSVCCDDAQNNLDTLYLDVYTIPRQDGDGIAHLPVPLETMIYNIDTTCNQKIEQIEQTIINIDETCLAKIEQIEQTIVNIDETCFTRIEQIEQTIVNIDETCFTRIEQIEQDVTDLQTNGSVCNTYNIETLYKDVYTTPSEDCDGDPNLTTPLETQISNLQAQVNGLSSEGPAIYVNSADTTPDVASKPSIVKIDYANPLSITDFDNGSIGQELVIVFTNNQTTIVHSSAISLMGGIDFNSEDEYVLTLIHNGIKWLEKSRNITTVV